jgi:DNA gyrase/topoisomerase IV subunit B
VAKAIEEGLAKKSAGLPAVSKDALRNRLMVFVKCSVENPTFDSQSKDALTSRPQVGVLGGNFAAAVSSVVHALNNLSST